MNEVEEIKNRLDIAEVVSGYLTLKKAGVNYKGKCPFHNEKTPSFMVSPERQTFKCFGCGEGGDVFTFIEKMEGIDFYNSLKLLADRAGVKLKEKSVKYGDREYKSDKKTKIFEINDWAKKLFQKILNEHPKAEHARKYLEKRGLGEKVINDFGIGYAPNSWDLLAKFLSQKGYEQSEIVAAGLAVRNTKGGVYDRFRGRITFPINNPMGATIAFTSRILEEDPNQAKYLNSAESPVYIKGRVIYGLDKAKMAIKESGLAVFVEGNMDVISCHQAGFKNVVATSGTAITEEQLLILSRYTDEVAFSFDNDDAGIAAMKKAVKLALKNDINARIISLPYPFKDPDEAIKSDPKNWEKAVKKSKPALEYWIDLLVQKNPDLEVSTKKKIAKEILPVIKAIFSPIEKEYYVKYLARKLSISDKTLLSAIEKTKSDQGLNRTEKEDALKTKLGMEEKVLAIIWINPDILKEIKIDQNIEQDGLKSFLKMITEGKVEKEKLSREEKAILDQLALSMIEELNSEDADVLKDELRFLLKRLSSEKNEKIKSEFASKIQQAESGGDKTKLKALLEEFSALIK